MKKYIPFILILIFVFFSNVYSQNKSNTKNWGSLEEGKALAEEIQKKFIEFSNRYPGSLGGKKCSEFIESEFARIVGKENIGSIVFRQPVFESGKFFLEVSEGIKIPLYPLTPNIVDLSNFEQEVNELNLVYGGDGTLKELDGLELKKSAVILNMKSSERWQEVVPFGAEAILFLEDDNYTFLDADHKSSDAPLTMPRFLVRKEDQAVLKAPDGASFISGQKIKIIAEKHNSWQNRDDLKNHFAYLKGKDDSRFMIISAHYDTNGFVPALSKNSADDINLALMLHLMEIFKKDQPAISIMFVAFDGYYNSQVGPSEFFWFAFANKEALEKEKKFYDDRLNLYSTVSDYYAEYSADKLDEMRDASTKINGRNYSWKKPMIDLLRGDQNKASEQIMNLTYSMKKINDKRKTILENSEKLSSLLDTEKAQWQISKGVSKEVNVNDEDIQSLQSYILSSDYALSKTVEEAKSLEEEFLKLSRNFARKENEVKIKQVQKEFEDKVAKLIEDLKIRNEKNILLKNLISKADKISDSDKLQNELIEVEGKYFDAISKLYKYKALKSDSIAIQKLFNGELSEQLFIKEKADEKRTLIDASYEPKIKKYFQAVADKSKLYKTAANLEVELLKKNSEIRKLSIHVNSEKESPKCIMAFDLNLTFGNDQFGLFTELNIQMNNATPVSYGRSSLGEFKEAGAFISNALNLSKNLLKAGGDNHLKNCIVDTTTTNRFNTFVLRNCFGIHTESKTSGVPAVVFVTTEDRSAKNNTTLNDYSQIDHQNLINLWNYLSAYIPLMVNESDFIKTSLKPYTSSFSSFIFNFVQQDNLAISVPETPVSNVILMFGGQSTSPISGLGSRTYRGSGYLDRRLLMSNAMGTVSLRNIRKQVVYGYEAYQYNQDFTSIVNAMDMRKGSKTFKNDINGLIEDFKEFTVPVFPCEKIDLYGVFDYEKMTRYNYVRILDGVQNSMPDNICVSGMPMLGGHPWVRVSRVNGGFAIFKKPDATVKVILENKVLLNSVNSDTKKNAIGLGYNRESLHRKSIAWESFKDAKNLNSYRNEVLISKGVKDTLVRQLNTKADEFYKKSEEQLEQKNYSGFFKNLYIGFGMVYASYPKVLQVMNDMIKAVVFYLALVIPFSFFIQRLCFPVTTIEKQLGINALVFFATFFAFRYIHPAFELTDAPLIVLIAFIQIVLAIFVFNVLYNKFDSRIKIIQGRTAGGDSASSNILTQALVIGVNNMRKRKIRTILTCVTIILVTFTMLSFTSISTAVDPTMRRAESKAPYSGVFYAKNSWSGISPDTFIQAFPNYSQAVRRAWFSRQGALFNIGIPANDTSFNVSTFLGLEKNDENFLGKLPISGKFFSSDDAREVILASGIAEILKVDMNNFEPIDVLIMGEKFKLVGFFDQKLMEDFKDIRGASILPQQPVGKAPSLSDLAELDESENDGNNNFRAMNPKMVGILPYKTALAYGGYTVSVSLKYDSVEKLWQDTKQFTTFSRENIYFAVTESFKTDPDAPAIRPGVFFIGNGFSTSIGGLADLIIPLIISATIIMNTMLGTVYERKKEIEIYTAVGLNPTQIGLFFIAESLVYGIIGSVSGYLIGQGASKVIDKYRLLEGIDLNFSSLLVVYVMVLTILIVVLSTIYPAFMAVKEAQPSGDGSNEVKLTIKDDAIVQLYPFSFTEAKRYAINSFLREYILKFADASTGSFMSRAISVNTEEHYDESTDFTTTGALIQKFDIALTPYDLGVTEVVELVTFYHPKVNAYMLKMVIHRVSGTDSNFLRTNQPFIDEIRKLLLRWRVESLAVQEKHQIGGEDLFSINSQVAEVTA